MADVNCGKEASLNEGALKRVDPYVKRILDTAKYVALYTFENETWTKIKIEGPLFVYERTAEPVHSILVLNRLDKKNLIEPITLQLDLQKNEPYLLYRNSVGKIFGIWFFEQAECIRISDLVQSLMKKSANRPARVETSGGPVDIFRMLTQAQEAFTSTEVRPIPESQVPATNDPTHFTPNSVADFFAKAGTGTVSEVPRIKKISESDGTQAQALGGLFQKLMANPAHSVEHIEKQQRVSTPLSADAATTIDPFKNVLRPRSMEIDRRAAVELAQPSSYAAPSNAHLVQPHHIFQPHSTNGINNGLAPKSMPSSPPGFPVVIKSECDLMPPAMFTPKEPAPFMRPRPFEPVNGAREPEGACHPLSTRSSPEPLTRNQLLQALQYLLRNDPDFITSIHDAYVKSLSEKILSQSS